MSKASDGDGERDGAVKVQRRARVALLRRARDEAIGLARVGATVLSGHTHDGDVLSQRGGDMAAEDGESGEVGNTAAAAFIVRART